MSLQERGRRCAVALPEDSNHVQEQLAHRALNGAYIDNWMNTFTVKRIEHSDEVTFDYRGASMTGTLRGGDLIVPGWAVGTILQDGNVRFADGGSWTRQYPVVLRVYEIGAGAYHAAVEVHGEEWQYAGGEGGGIMSIIPGSATGYARQLDPMPMDYTSLTRWDVHKVVHKMDSAWKGSEYNLIHQNCCHFSRRFLQELGAATMPEWVDGWTDKVTPAVEAAAGAVASRGVVLGAELVAARGLTMYAGPAAWGAAAGDLMGAVIGDRLGGAVGGAEGADTGREIGSISGSVGVGAGVGGMIGGPIGAGIGAGVGVMSWGVGKLVRAAIGEAPAAIALSQDGSSQRGNLQPGHDILPPVSTCRDG
eukprot:TRINITY_DN88791_c0_g1_i1.p1 TRINITY_DN88791_c0_g1~~TRINITY_DN88791_c0_g1_i1.p1  ORF type:complete len:364 (-),score=49.10 TRINITY_DN88791_c0_g1_i1:209-1300(-)